MLIGTQNFMPIQNGKILFFYTYLGLLFLPNKANNKSYDIDFISNNIYLIKAKK